MFGFVRQGQIDDLYEELTLNQEIQRRRYSDLRQRVRSLSNTVQTNLDATIDNFNRLVSEFENQVRLIKNTADHNLEETDGALAIIEEDIQVITAIVSEHSAVIVAIGNELGLETGITLDPWNSGPNMSPVPGDVMAQLYESWLRYGDHGIEHEDSGSTITGRPVGNSNGAVIDFSEFPSQAETAFGYSSGSDPWEDDVEVDRWDGESPAVGGPTQ